ncbi:MAG: TetR/AcrR family transcriptional regulator [Chloroflexota bacterium]
MEVKLDRRKQRTRRMLREALISEILEQGYDAVTVQDITERADLRRATFYLHYKDKDELLLTVLQETFDALVVEIGPAMHGDILAGKTQIEPFRITFQHVADNADLYRIILGGQGGAAIAQRIQAYLAALVTHALRSASPASLALPIDVIANYLAGAELSLIAWWLNSGQPYPAEEMAHMTQRLILQGVLDVVDVKSVNVRS